MLRRLPQDDTNEGADTEDEKDKFFEDAMFQATNLTDGQTFADVLPLMNWWAGFSPSAESGVGVGGQPLE